MRLEENLRPDVQGEFLDFSTDLPALLFEQVRRGASASCDVLGWKAEEARAAIRPVVEWLSFAGRDRPPTPMVAELMSKLNDGDD